MTDLEALANKHRTENLSPAEVETLIAAVEALREREADWDGDRRALVNRVAAAEARVAELESALEWFDTRDGSLATDLITAHRSRGEGLSQWMREEDRELRAEFAKAMEQARTALASTPAEALERARAKDEVISTARLVAKERLYRGGRTPEQPYNLQNVLANLDALQPTEGDGKEAIQGEVGREFGFEEPQP